MKLVRSTATVGGLTLVSRITGFLRDVVIARAFGASALTDAFFVALRIPNLLRRLFAEGAFSLALVPVLSEYRRAGDQAALRQLIDAVAGALLAVLLVVIGLGVLGAAGLVWLFAPGFADDPALFGLTTHMLRITLPYALLISLVALGGSILNSCGRFAIPAFTPVLLNVALIGAALGLAPLFDPPIVALAWGVLVAGFLQLAFQFPALLRLGLLPRPRLLPEHDGLQRINRMLGPAILGSSVAQINVMVDTLIASLLSAGAISWLYYSDRLLEFPLGVFGIAIATVILPSLAHRHAGQDAAGFSAILDWGLRLASLIAFPAALGLGLLAAPIVITLFHHGEFDAVSAQMTAASVTAYAAGLPAYVAVKVLAPAFYARYDTRTPVRAAVAALVTNAVLNVLFVWALQRYPVGPPHAGLAVASSLSAWLNASLLYRSLRRQDRHRPLPGWPRHLAVIATGCAAMSAFLLWRAQGAASWLTMDLGPQLAELALLVIGGGLIYVAVVGLLGALHRHLLEPPAA